MQVIDVGGNHYLDLPIIKNRRQMSLCSESIHDVVYAERTRGLPLAEVEAMNYFYELELWQAHWNIDCQYQFDVAEVLFRKHILKNSEAGPA